MGDHQIPGLDHSFSGQAETSRNNLSPAKPQPGPEAGAEDFTQIVSSKRISQMRKDMAARKLKKAKKSFLAFFRSFDIFGKPIQLNYKGDDNFKTIGGSILTLVMCCMLFVAVMKSLNKLFDNRDWTERTNVEILDREELEEGVVFSDFGHFKAGFEIKPRETSAIRRREQYLELAELVADLFYVNEVSYVQNSSGVFMEADKPDTRKLGFDFVQLLQPIRGHRHESGDASYIFNSQGYLEFSIDLNGTTISGSDATTMDVSNKYVSFLHSLDKNRFYKRIYEACKANETCRAILKSDSQVFNSLSEVNFCDEARNQSQKEAYSRFLQQAILDEDQKYFFYHEFYTSLETVTYSSNSGMSFCDQVARQVKAGNEPCDYDSGAILGSKCLYKEHSANLTARLRNAQELLHIKPVIYDSVKNVKDGENSTPFQERKSRFSTPIAKEFLRSDSYLVENYIVSLAKSKICMDDGIYAEMSISHRNHDKCFKESVALTEADYSVSFLNVSAEVTSILTLTLDNKSELTVVRYFKVYDMLAQNGGLLYALIVMFSLLGHPLSQIQFRYSVAQESYYTRDKKENLNEKYKPEGSIKSDIVRIDKTFNYQKIKELFPKIRFTSAFYAISACCKCFICKQCKSMRDQKKILKRANLKFRDELDVIQLLKKVRLSTDIWTQLLSKSQKKALKFSRSNVVIQKEKKKNKIIKRANSVFEKIDDPNTSSDSISFSISHSSSMSSEYREEVQSEPEARIEEAHSFFQLPVANMLPLPKRKKMPPAVVRKKKREKLLSEYSNASSSALNISKFEQPSPGLIPPRKKRGLDKAMISSSSEKDKLMKVTSREIKITTLGMTLGDPQFGSVKLSKNLSDMNAVRLRQQSKQDIEIGTVNNAFEMTTNFKKHRHHRRRKRSSSRRGEEDQYGADEPDTHARRLVKKKEGFLDEAEYSQVTPQDSRHLQPFGGDAPTPLASERMPNRSSAELRMRKRKKRKKRESTKSEIPAPADIGQPAFNSETINAEDQQ